MYMALTNTLLKTTQLWVCIGILKRIEALPQIHGMKAKIPKEMVTQ